MLGLVITAHSVLRKIAEPLFKGAFVSGSEDRISLMMRRAHHVTLHGFQVPTLLSLLVSRLLATEAEGRKGDASGLLGPGWRRCL